MLSRAAHKLCDIYKLQQLKCYHKLINHKLIVHRHKLEKHTEKNVSKFIGILNRLKHVLPLEIKIMLYNALILLTVLRHGDIKETD